MTLAENQRGEMAARAGPWCPCRIGIRIELTTPSNLNCCVGRIDLCTREYGSETFPGTIKPGRSIMLTNTCRMSGPWSPNEIETYLASTVIPLRLSVTNTAGWPIVLSLWFICENGKLLATSRTHSKVIAYLTANPRCGFEIARETPPYCGVRGYGVAELSQDRDAKMLRRLSARYLGHEDTPFNRWLISGANDETTISITPRSWMSWDYRARMGAQE